MDQLLLNNYFSIGEFKVYYYAICIVSGFIACACFAIPLFKKRGLNPDLMLDIFIAIIPCAIVCARLWYVLFDLDEFITDGAFDFLKAINIRTGGMAIHGGVCGGALGLFIISKIKKIKFGRLGDLGAAMLPLGQAVGRLGNFFNQEVYGYVVPESKAWFPYATFIEADGQWHVALCFHEMFFNLLLFVALYLFLMNYKGKRNGYAISLYFIFYGIIRACMEPMREQTFNMGVKILGMPTMFWFSMLIMISGVALFTVLLVQDIKEKNYWWKGFFTKKPAEEPATEPTETETGTAESTDEK